MQSFRSLHRGYCHVKGYFRTCNAEQLQLYHNTFAYAVRTSPRILVDTVYLLISIT